MAKLLTTLSLAFLATCQGGDITNLVEDCGKKGVFFIWWYEQLHSFFYLHIRVTQGNN